MLDWLKVNLQYITPKHLLSRLVGKLAAAELGGFTTFSAFSLEMVLLIERGQYLFALLYAFLSIALGITGLMVGLGVMRMAG